MPVDAVEVYERLKRKLGQEETNLLLRFVEETVTMGAARKQDLRGVEAGLKELIHNLEMKLLNVRSELREDISQLRQDLIKFKSDARLYFLIILGVVVITNPKVIELIAKLLALLK